MTRSHRAPTSAVVTGRMTVARAASVLTHELTDPLLHRHVETDRRLVRRAPAAGEGGIRRSPPSSFTEESCRTGFHEVADLEELDHLVT